MERLTHYWVPRLWLPVVVVMTAAVAILLSATPFNPARVPALVVILVFWAWMWGWYRLHHVVSEFSPTWFGAQFLVVVLTGLGVLWSVSYVATRDEVGLRSTSPDGAMTVVGHYPLHGNEIRVDIEALGGLLLSRGPWIEFRNPRLRRDLRPPMPERFTLVWAPDGRTAVLSGDGTAVALFDHVSGTLMERQDLRFNPVAIAAAFGTPTAPRDPAP